MRMLLVSLWLCASAQVSLIAGYSEIQDGATTYRVVRYNNPDADCPYYLMLQVMKHGEVEFLPRRMQSCTGLSTLTLVGKRLSITVPSDDNSGRTFFYTYVYGGKWLDKGRP